MPSKMSKTKLKMRMTRRTSAKQESSPQPPAKAIKTSLEGNHYQSQQQQQQHQRQRSAGDSASSDTHSKISNAPSVKSNASYKSDAAMRSNFPMAHKKQQRDERKIQSVATTKAPPPPHPDDKSSQSSASSDEKHCELDGPIYKRYTIRTRLGKGAYGIVWEAYEKSTGNKVALKKIFDAFRNDTDAQRTYREIMFLREFGNHPNIIRLLNVHRAVNNMDIYLVFPFMEHDLHRVIKESPQMLKDNHIRMIFYQTLKAVKYLHSGDVIHRDLKPANILLDDYLNVKVADFGLARSLSSLEDVMSEANPVMTDYVATRWYRPPEILLSCPFYTKGVDMWSLGCILGEMILKVPLFPGGSTVHQVETIMAHIAPPTPAEIEEMCGQNTQSTLIESAMTYRKRSLSEIFELCDDDTIDLLQKFLVFNPDKRITAEETLAHPYLSRYRRLSEEMTMSHPVCPPLNDYIQLPMCQYRSVIYDLIQVRKSRQQQQPHPFFSSPQQQQQQQQAQRQDLESPIPTPVSKSNSHQGNNVTMTTNNPNQDTRRVRSLNSDCNKIYNNTTTTTTNKSKRENDRDFRKCYSVKTVQINDKVTSSADLSPRPTTAGDKSVENEGRKMAWHGEATKSSNNTRKNNSTSNIPQVRKVPGPDGDGHDLPLPYLKIVSTAPGLQGKNPRLFDRSDLSARNSHPVPSDLRGADKRLYEIYSHTEDLEEEIKAIEYQVRVKRVPAQAQWIQDLSTNLTKASVSDPTPSNSSTTTSELAAVKSCASSAGNFKGHSRVPNQQTKLPEILQSWNQTCSKSVVAAMEPSKQSRRSTYFQDPPPPVNKVMGQRLQVRMAVSPKELQGQRQQQGGYQQQYSRCTTPIEATQAKSKHYESYSQTHGTISASDLTDLKANIGLGK